MNGKNLKILRLAIGLSQSKLADLSGIEQAKISFFELGKSNISPNEIAILKKIINNLNCKDIKKIKKKRYHTIDDGKKIINSRPRKSYSKTNNNSKYIKQLQLLENKFKDNLKDDAPKAISFFAGCGGLCYGMRAAGFNIVATNELVENYKDIYRKNFPNVTFFKNDIRDITKEDLKPFIDIDLMIGGPPCQGFSLAGKRDINDKRNTLFQNYLDISSIVKPKVIIMENVRLLTSMKDTDDTLIKDIILTMFQKYGYKSNFFELNAKNFGVPQHRERVFFIGIRDDLDKIPSVPNLLYSDSKNRGFLSKTKKVFTFGDAVSDLTFIESSEKSSTDVYHKAVKHPEHVLRWLIDVPEGKSAHDNLDKNLKPPSGYNTTYKRQVWNEPSATVTTTFAMISGCRNVHPIATRSLTIREALRLQSFPDSFKLKGTLGNIRTTIGNAVPPKLAYEIGNHIRKTIFCKNSLLED